VPRPQGLQHLSRGPDSLDPLAVGMFHPFIVFVIDQEQTLMISVLKGAAPIQYLPGRVETTCIVELETLLIWLMR
jgi:hypothetical protein